MEKSNHRLLSKGRYINLRQQGYNLRLVPTKEGPGIS